MFNLRIVILGTTLAVTLGCTHSPQPALPDAVLAALRLPTSLRATVVLGTDGAVRKSTAYVPREAMPEWVLTMAEEKLGAGEDVEFEVEVYEDGVTVYEVTRRVAGEEVELSVNADKSVRYLEKTVDPAKLPEAVATAVAAIDGFVPAKAALKEAAGAKQYQVTGQRDGRTYRLVLDETGKQMGKSRVLAAELHLDE